MFRYSMWTLDYQPQNGKGQEELDDLWAKVWRDLYLLATYYMLKYNGKNSIYILLTINYNFMSVSKAIRK